MGACGASTKMSGRGRRAKGHPVTGRGGGRRGRAPSVAGGLGKERGAPQDAESRRGALNLTYTFVTLDPPRVQRTNQTITPFSTVDA